MADVEMLRKLAGLEPDQRGRHIGHQKSRNRKTIFRSERTGVTLGHQEVQQVFFTFKLVSERTDGAFELAFLVVAEVGKANSMAAPNVIKQIREDGPRAFGFFLARVEGHS